MSDGTIAPKRRRDKTATNIGAEPAWQNPPEFIEARRDEVHVWRAQLDIASSRVQNRSRLLSVDERERAQRFHFDRDRNNFITARAFLRILMGRYLRTEPSEVKFDYGSNGKPFLATAESTAVRFNLSHSKDLALYAVADGREIGIDVECISERVEVDSIAERFFSPPEVAAFRALPGELKRQAFFACWTRKEAYIKARGEGLSMPLDQFSVSLSPGEAAVLREVRWDPEEVSRWSLSALPLDPHYVGAVAVEGHDWSLKFWELTAETQNAATTAGCEPGIGGSEHPPE
ncbi:MAG TPA: 4'-phosphopantetheinyl transferase superfamily protein [Candidatus Binatia bacterium]|jgi:4'-phosphopantetheinyl transferase